MQQQLPDTNRVEQRVVGAGVSTCLFQQLEPRPTGRPWLLSGCILGTKVRDEKEHLADDYGIMQWVGYRRIEYLLGCTLPDGLLTWRAVQAVQAVQCIHLQ